MAQRKPSRTRPLDTITSQTGVPLPKSYLQACVYLVRGDTAKAQAEFEAARPAIEKLVADSPQDGTRRAQLGLLYAFLGRKEDALREGKRAMELIPITHDVIEGAVSRSFLHFDLRQTRNNRRGDQPNRTLTHHAVRRRL